MDSVTQAMSAAKYFGRRADAFESLVDNMTELSTVAEEQLLGNYRAAVEAAFAMGVAVGRMAGGAE